jgi:UDP-N-acetylglucosamine diphosphorylase / glucose-1-phosphate thymidylyltransferase / UDP-N-acetylgalactosamine diphosphorylase / glucosamine-1-phosphate N-acetyltransferase / galactosamine-1-phosphate N-acetyltransferase
VRLGATLHLLAQSKFGALVGDGAQLGANSVLAPGALLMPGAVLQRGALCDQELNPC